LGREPSIKSFRGVGGRDPDGRELSTRFETVVSADTTGDR
jgi:hypothetical protein